MAKGKKTNFYTIPKIRTSFSNGQPKENSGAVFSFFFHIGNVVLKVVLFIVAAVLKTCFSVGNALFAGTAFSASLLLGEIKRTRNVWVKRIQKALQPEFARSIAVFAVISLFGLGSFQAIRLVARGLELKGSVLGISAEGGKYLLEAKNALEDQDFDQASNKFLLAYESFTNGQKQLKDAGTSLSGLLRFVPQAADANNILQASRLTASSGNKMLSVYQQLKQLSVGPQGVTSSGQPVSEIIRETDAALGSVLTDLTLARNNLAAVNESNLPTQYRPMLLDMRQQLLIATNALSSFKDVFSLISRLISGKKNVLVLFENYNELRPAGGFIGTFGDFKIENGSIISSRISSVYDLDGQLKEKIMPPIPVLNVNDRWFLRDSNWFAHFPDSAKTVSDFYEKEGGETPDVVIAITPQLIIDMLKLTGPITLSSYGVTLTPENFIELTQVASTLSYNSPENKPKQVLADLFPVLLQKIGLLEPMQLSVFFEILQNNLNNKQVVLFSTDSELQAQAQNFNWTGAIATTDRDYLSIVSANLGGTKSDLAIKQNVILKTVVGDNGEIINELTIIRKNTLPDMSQTNNSSFIRVLVPLGSNLISNSGFDKKDQLSTIGPKTSDYKTHSRVFEWENKSVRDVISGTQIGVEAGKTYFANWIELKGGESKTVTLVYKLPFSIKNVDHYSLTLQKQIGMLGQSVRLEMHFPGRNLEWKNFDPDTLETSSYVREVFLERDNFMGTVFVKR